MFYSNNPIRDFERYDAEQCNQLAHLPACADCGEHIQDETAFYINGEWICEDCMDAYRREVLTE